MPRTLVNNGRVTSRDPSLHGEGEVSEAQDCYYAPADPALRSVLGRTAFNATAEPPLESGVHLAFDYVSALIVVLGRGASVLRKATAGLTGTFSDLAGFDGSDYSLSPGATLLDAAHYRDQHILVDGVSRPRVVGPGGTQMFLGMLETTEPPVLSRDGGAETGFILTAGKTITYWIEERVMIGTTVIKRSSPTIAGFVTLTGDGSTDQPRLTRPTTFANPDTTHWALMSTSTDGAYPIGAEVAYAQDTTTTLDDDRVGTDPGLPDGDAFEIVSLRIGGITQNHAKWGPPPIASTIDIFEDCVYMNDVALPSETAFSYTDNIHAWPAPFRVKFSTKAHDVVKAVREMDNFVLVLLQNGLWRVNQLPKSTDQAFEPERMKSEIVGAFGIVNAKALAKFSFGEGERLAYVSPHGAIVTEGSRWTTISDDADWETTVNTAQVEKIRLINNPRYYRMEMPYPPVGASRDTKELFMHYHPSHAKSSEQGGLRAKLTWPINRDMNDIFVGKIGGIDTVFSVNEDGRVYVHDSGFTEPVASEGIVMKVRTSDDYPGTVGAHTTLRDLRVHHQAASGLTAKARVISRNSGEDDAPGEANVPLDRREATPTGIQAEAEAFQLEFEVTNPTAQVVLDYFVPSYDLPSRTEAK